MPNYDMGTAHGRIRIDYEGDGAERASQGLRNVGNSSNDADHNMVKLISNVVTLTTLFGGFAAVTGGAAVVAVGSLAAAFSSAGVALGAFQAAVKPQLSAIGEVGKKYDQAIAAINSGSDDAKEKVKAYKDALAQLPPATQKTAVAFFGLKNAFKNWSDSLAGTTMPVFTRGIELLRAHLPALTPLVQVAASALGGLMTQIEKGAKGGGIERFTSQLAGIASIVLPQLFRSLANVGKGLFGILKAFLPVSSTLTGGIEGLTEKFAKWGQSLSSSVGFQKFIENMKTGGPEAGKVLKDLLTVAVNLVKAFAPFTGASIALTSALASLVAAIPVPVLKVLVGVITAATIATKLYAASVAIISAATKAWGVVQWILNSALLANPIFLLIASIVVLVGIIVLIATKTKFFQTVWDAVWGAIKVAFAATVDFIKQHWQLIIAIILGPLGIVVGLVIKHWTQIKNFIMGVVNAVINFVREHWKLIVAILGGPLGIAVGLVIKYWSQIKSFVLTVTNAVIGFIRSFASRMVQGIRNIASIVGIIATIFNNWRKAITDRVASALKTISGIQGKINGAFAGAARWLFNAGVNIIQGLINGIVSMFRSLQNTLNSVTRVIPDWKGPARVDKKLLIKNGQMIMGGLIRGFESFLPQVKLALNNVSNVMANSTAQSIPPSFTNGLDSFTIPATQSILSATATLPSDLVDRLVEAMRSAGVGSTYLDGRLVSSQVGRIQGRDASFQRRTR